MSFRDRPIRRKLTTIILLTSGAVLLLTCAAFFAYELLTFPQTAVRNLSTLGEIIAANSTAALAFKNQDDAKEILAAGEATDICVNSPIMYGGWHLLGTARMGTDPDGSVVNEWGRSHDVKNLFIVDGSLFVTSGGVNPTSTIQALALYVADQMKQRLANLFD